MRECSEELGINLDQIELLGNLDCLVSAIGVKLYAVAVRLHTSDLKPNPMKWERCLPYLYNIC